MADYKEQYLDPRWQKKRLEILQRDNWTCQFCGSKEKTLHVHHLDYEYGSKLWEQPNLTMITLCDSCHEIEQSFSKECAKNLIKTLKQYLTANNLSILEDSFSMAFQDCEHKRNDIIKNRPGVLVILVNALLENQEFQDILLKAYREKANKECSELPNGIEDMK